MTARLSVVMVYEGLGWVFTVFGGLFFEKLEREWHQHPLICSGACALPHRVVDLCPYSSVQFWQATNARRYGRLQERCAMLPLQRPRGPARGTRSIPTRSEPRNPSPHLNMERRGCASREQASSGSSLLSRWMNRHAHQSE